MHWIAFCGEPPKRQNRNSGPNEINRRLSSLDRFAKIGRENMTEFVRNFVDSLKSFSTVYPEVMRPDVFKDRYDTEQEDKRFVLNRLNGLHTYGSCGTPWGPLLLVLFSEYEKNDNLLQECLSTIESFVFRYNVILMRGADSYRTTVKNEASRAFWSRFDDETYARTFNQDPESESVDNSCSKVIYDIIEEVRSRREDKASDDIVEEYLHSQNVIEGEFTDGWTGIRSKKGIKFLLYEFERTIRSDMDSSDIRHFGYWDENYELEHLVPKNAPKGHKLQYHKKNVNRLGNLALIGEKQNNSNNNKPYMRKYRDTFNESPIKMLRELKGPEFEVSDVKERSELLADFAMERW
jgi:hypothetical protein